MTEILADAEMAKQFQEAKGPVQVIDDKGAVIGVFTPIKCTHSPFSREELERRREAVRKNPEHGKTTAEVLVWLKQLDRGAS